MCEIKERQKELLMLAFANVQMMTLILDELKEYKAVFRPKYRGTMTTFLKQTMGINERLFGFKDDFNKEGKRTFDEINYNTMDAIEIFIAAATSGKLEDFIKHTKSYEGE